MQTPEKLDVFIKAIFNESRVVTSLSDLLIRLNITSEEYEKIYSWFKNELKIKL